MFVTLKPRPLRNTSARKLRKDSDGCVIEWALYFSVSEGVGEAAGGDTARVRSGLRSWAVRGNAAPVAGGTQ